MSGQRVLVVDDDPDITLLLRLALRREGYDVEAAANGEEAMGRAQASMPDCILLDVMMPGIDGLETCRRLRDDPRTCSCPVIMLTGVVVDVPEEDVLNTGADDWMPKPFDITTLVARVRDLINRRQPA
jgi:DNA-binding response OmpR family regulator